MSFIFSLASIFPSIGIASHQHQRAPPDASSRRKKCVAFLFVLFFSSFASHIFFRSLWIHFGASSAVCINFHFYYYNFFVCSAFGVCRKKIINSRLKPQTRTDWMERSDDDKNKIFFRQPAREFFTLFGWRAGYVLSVCG